MNEEARRAAAWYDRQFNFIEPSVPAHCTGWVGVHGDGYDFFIDGRHRWTFCASCARQVEQLMREPGHDRKWELKAAPPRT